MSDVPWKAMTKDEIGKLKALRAAHPESVTGYLAAAADAIPRLITEMEHWKQRAEFFARAEGHVVEQGIRTASDWLSEKQNLEAELHNANERLNKLHHAPTWATAWCCAECEPEAPECAAAIPLRSAP